VQFVIGGGKSQSFPSSPLRLLSGSLMTEFKLRLSHRTPICILGNIFTLHQLVTFTSKNPSKILNKQVKGGEHVKFKVLHALEFEHPFFHRSVIIFVTKPRGGAARTRKKNNNVEPRDAPKMIVESEQWSQGLCRK
jgi:hypothetical protein